MVREDEIRAGRYKIPGRDRQGYNGVTGAKAAWNESKNTWIDDAGEEIREDAIVDTPKAVAPTPPGAPPAPPPPPGVPPAHVAPGGRGVSQFAEAEPMSGGGSCGGPGYQSGSPGALNPYLGSRVLSRSLSALAQAAGRNY